MYGNINMDEARKLTAAIRGGGEFTDNELDLAFAHAMWSGIAEPGDGVAGKVIALLGADDALEHLMAGTSAEGLRGVMLVAAVGDRDDWRMVDVVDLQQGIDRWKPRAVEGTMLVWLRQAAKFDAVLRIPTDEGWPAGLADLGAHAPIALWTRGKEDAWLSLSRSIAIVGARAATGYGEHEAMEFSAGLVDRGFAVVSGAAYGIDGFAHRAALASNGKTIAFLAGGVDRFYPLGHDALLTRIVQHGLVVSELPPGSAPTRWRFLQRNRLIAAVSQATVVVEAGRKSGSLNTASHARDMGRPVGAVPGPVTSAASAGCHHLIATDQARLVTSAEDVAELLPQVEVAPAE